MSPVDRLRAQLPPGTRWHFSQDGVTWMDGGLVATAAEPSPFRHVRFVAPEREESLRSRTRKGPV